MTCGWKLEHQPWRTPWKVARRRVCSTDEVPICGAPVTWPQSGSSPRRILSNPSPCKLSSPPRNSGGALPAEMAVPFCVLLEGQASSCTEPTATWQRLNAAGGGGEISYRAAVKRRHPLARSPSVVRRAKVDGFIRSCRLPDVPGVKLNAELLEGRTPVVVMEARPLKLRQF